MKRNISLIRLSRDHQRGLALSQLLEREVPAAGPEQLAGLRNDTIEFWRTGLLPHFRAECECLLARLVRHITPDHELIQRTEQDHLRVHAIVASLREEAEPATVRVLLTDLGSLLRDHIRWEESVLFEVAQTRLQPEELEALGADLTERLPEIPPALFS